MTQEKKAHGGYRAGSGRKPKYATVQLTPYVLEKMDIVKKSFPGGEMTFDETLLFCLVWVASQEEKIANEKKGIEG